GAMIRRAAGITVVWLTFSIAAKASEIRLASLGGVEWAVADESEAFNLFTLDNAAGLGLLPRANRLDEALDVSNAADVTDSGAVKTTRTSKVTSLASPGG